MNLSEINQQLVAENQQLRNQLAEALETIYAIRTGQVDALVIDGDEGHELFTLKTADQTYRVFIETMHEGVVTLDENGDIIYCNSQFATMVARPLSDVIGTSFAAFIVQTDYSRYADFFQRCWMGPEKMELLIGFAELASPCLISASALLLDEGPCLSLFLTDLTTQKEVQALLKVNNEQLGRLNTALERSNQALNRSNDNLQQFAYVASHDLQEPLRKIQQFGNLLSVAYADQLGSQGVDYIRRMESAASRMSTLIRDLLSYSRLTTTEKSLSKQDLNQIVQAVLMVLEVEIDETKAEIEVGQLGTAFGDATQLGQVFQNLLTNALKFTRVNSVPVIRINRQSITQAELPSNYQFVGDHDQFALIQVSDNGIGFEPQQAERIFGTFQRLHGRNTYPGNGIGLAIVKKVIENHQGYILAQSQPGQGATFSIYLPD